MLRMLLVLIIYFSLCGCAHFPSFFDFEFKGKIDPKAMKV